jgi:hypothetical protein
MKAITLFATGLLLTACAAPGTRDLYSGKLTAPAPSLADELPADTLVYVEIADVQGMREKIATSDLGLMYHDEEMQTFLAGGLSLLNEGWADLRAAIAEEGYPSDLMSWDTLESFAMGMALRGEPGLENPFDREPQIYVRADLGIAPDKIDAVYTMLSDMLVNEGAQMAEGSNGSKMSIQMGALSMTFTKAVHAIQVEGTMGAKGEGSLSSNQEFRRSRLQVQADGAAMFGYMAFTPVFETLYRGIMSEPEVEAFASVIDSFYTSTIQPLNGMAFASGWDENGTYTYGKVDLSETSQDEGSLYRVLPYDPELLTYIPAEATGFSVMGSDQEAGMQMALDMMDELAATEMEGMTLGAMLQMQSAEAHDWLFGSHRPEMEAAMKSFGNRSFSYSISNGLDGEDLAFSEVNDPAALNAMLEQLMPRLKEVVDPMGEGMVTLKMKRVSRTVTNDGVTEKVRGPAYYYLDIDLSSIMPPEVAGFIQLQPTMGVSDDGWMVFSMSRNSVRSILIDGMPIPEANILENEDVQGFLARVPDDAYAISWGDPRPTVDALASMALGFAPMVMGPLEQEMDIPFSLDDLPSAALFTRYLRPSETIGYATHGDLITESHGSIGLADMFTLFGTCVNVGGPLLMMGMDQAVMMDEEVMFDEFDSESDTF